MPAVLKVIYDLNLLSLGGECRLSQLYGEDENCQNNF
jgi:hypothetical protein